MKHSNGSIVIASIPNHQGTRVYIPEKVWLDKLYVQPYRFYKSSIKTDLVAGIFLSSYCAFEIETSLDTITVTEPFTRRLLDHYLRKAAKNVQRQADKRQEVRIENVTISQLHPEHLEIYLQKQTGDPTTDARLIIMLGDADMQAMDT